MKIRVGVLFGGKTTEHEVSIITAVQAMEFLDGDKYDVIPMYLTKENELYTGSPLKEMEVYKEPELLKRYCKNVVCYNKNGCLTLQNKNGIFKKTIAEVDIVIPCVHGYNMEDGNVQGMLETYGVPYTGSDIYGCTVGQDKVFQKQILQAEGVPVPKYTWFYDNEYYEDEEKILSSVKKIGYPVIVKPARQGSSIGIQIAKDEESLKQAIEEAVKYDEKILESFIETLSSRLNLSVERYHYLASYILLLEGCYKKAYLHLEYVTMDEYLKSFIPELRNYSWRLYRKYYNRIDMPLDFLMV